jgi:putative molybdopterin biosynthesis protein
MKLESAMESKFLTTSEVSERLQVSPRTVQRLIQRGELKAFRVGRQVRIPELALKEMLEARRLGVDLSSTYSHEPLF